MNFRIIESMKLLSLRLVAWTTNNFECQVYRRFHRCIGYLLSDLMARDRAIGVFKEVQLLYPLKRNFKSPLPFSNLLDLNDEELPCFPRKYPDIANRHVPPNAASILSRICFPYRKTPRQRCGSDTTKA